MGHVFAHGRLSGRCLGDAVVFEFHLGMDILGSFLCSCCLHTALDLFLACALCFIPVDDDRIVRVSCGFGVDKWPAPGLWFPSEETIEPKL